MLNYTFNEKEAIHSNDIEFPPIVNLIRRAQSGFQCDLPSVSTTLPFQNAIDHKEPSINSKLSK